MKHALPFGTVLLAAALLWGCAEGPKPAQAKPPEDATYCLARFDRVWDASIEALAEEQIPVDSANKDRGVISSKLVTYSSGPEAHRDLDAIAVRPSSRSPVLWSQVRYTLSIMVTPVNDLSTRVKVTAHIEAYDRNVSREWHECISSKAIEARIIEKIKTQI